MMAPRIILTYLNFFNGFEYDPTPEAEAMVAVGDKERGESGFRGI
jgi:hypothetical protein